MLTMPKKKRKPKRWLYPLAIEREYEQLLTAYADSLVKEVEARLPLLNLRLDSIEDIPESTGWFEDLRVWLLGFLGAGNTLPSIKQIMQATDRFNRQQFHAVFRSVFGVDIFTTEPFLADLLAAWEAENIKLIKSIPSQYLDQLHGKIVAAVRAGKPSKVIAEVVRETFDLPRNRAKLIARDQIGKLNGQLTMARQKNIGVENYVWRTSLDERVREEHKHREGEKFSWDEPPKDGHPGNPINCRCSAEAVFPDLEDLKGVVYGNTL
nr:phage minor head protein [uncultured Neisseria sp.]